MDSTGFLIAYIVQGTIFGFITKHVAESKGYDGGFAWGFWLGIIGLIVVGFKPNIQHNGQTEANTFYNGALEPRNRKPVEKWECSCGEKNPATLSYCVSCRRNRSDVVLIKKINCPHCGAINKETNQMCFACNKTLHDELENALSSSKEKSGVMLDYLEALESLAKLHKQGILTDQEYQVKKAEILGKI